MKDFTKKYILLIVITAIWAFFLGRMAGTLLYPPDTTTEDPQTTTESEFIGPPELMTIEIPEEQPETAEIPSPPYLDIPLNDDIKSFIYEKCEYDDEMYCLVMAVIKQESDFDPENVSADGHDRGLMQLRDTYYDYWIEKYDVSDPEELYDNLTVGITMLQEYIEKYQYKNLALMCYNCGEAGAKRLWKKDTYSTRYTDKVLGYYETYIGEVTP